MQLIVQYSNLLTFGNILAIITGIGSVLTAVALVYWRFRTFWTRQHILYLAQVNELLDAQTKRIESCIHQIPGHPEQTVIDNSTLVQEENQ